MWTKIKPNLSEQTNDERGIFYAHKGVFNWDMLNAFIKANGIVSVRKGRGTCTLKWFLQNGRDVPFKAYPRQRKAIAEILGNHLPRGLDDHDYYFKMPHGECVYISQPYVSKEYAEPLVQMWADLHKVKAVVYDGTHSWYYPCSPENADKVCVIVVSLPDRHVSIPTLYGDMVKLTTGEGDA